LGFFCFYLSPNQACLAQNPLPYQLKSVYPFDGYQFPFPFIMLPISPFRSRMEVMMTEHPKNLGELKEADLRSVWPDEAQDFTPWLAG